MKFLGAFLAAVLCAPACLFAQATVGSVEIGGGGGRFYGGSFPRGSNREFVEKVAVDDDVQKGFWLGARLSGSWGLEIAVRRSSADIVRPAGGVFPNEPTVATIDFATIELGALRFFPIGQFSPYVGAAAGVSNLDINVPDRSVRDVNRLALSACVGAKFYATPWVGARVDVRARATALRSRHAFWNSEVLGGVFFSFGGKARKPA
jgi:hypothetical protein